jgi:hypothetical protein
MSNMDSILARYKKTVSDKSNVEEGYIGSLMTQGELLAEIKAVDHYLEQLQISKNGLTDTTPFDKCDLDAVEYKIGLLKDQAVKLIKKYSGELKVMIDNLDTLSDLSINVKDDKEFLKLLEDKKKAEETMMKEEFQTIFELPLKRSANCTRKANIEEEKKDASESDEEEKIGSK